MYFCTYLHIYMCIKALQYLQAMLHPLSLPVLVAFVFQIRKLFFNFFLQNEAQMEGSKVYFTLLENKGDLYI